MDGFCVDTTKVGRPCRARPVAGSTRCLSHAPERASVRAEQRRKGGQLVQARRALAKAKSDAIAKFGIETPLPTLDSVDSARDFLVGVAGKVLKHEISPAAGNCLVAVVRASKELLALETDIKLAEQLDALDDVKGRRS